MPTRWNLTGWSRTQARQGRVEQPQGPGRAKRRPGTDRGQSEDALNDRRKTLPSINPWSPDPPGTAVSPSVRTHLNICSDPVSEPLSRSN